MKVLGISFGKKNANTDIVVKEALYGAKAAGAEVAFVNTVNLKIGRCIGCGACSRMFEDEGKPCECIIKDDFQALEEKIWDADAVVVGAPVYVLQPVGQFKDFVDRFSCRNDQAKIERVIAQRKANGGPEVDPRMPKRRYVSYISVGGASTQHWVSMGLPTMHLFGFPPLMHVVGEIDAYSMGTRGNPALDEALMSRCNELGRRTAEAVGKPPEEVEWFGAEGTCPVCHQMQVTLRGTTTVECPVCGIEGKLHVEGDKVWVDFPPEQRARARSTMPGLVEHDVEIKGFGAIAGPIIQANQDRLPELLKRYKEFESEIEKV
ncbi:flavodoxin family protein [Ruminococcaceae bacterium OttesenSCG-928-D13]|nr:flavodoxin family protein [Ruminococcaceae bacterium OttesenSCG-928-D13]